MTTITKATITGKRWELRFLATAAAFVLLPVCALALPQFSLLTGNKCLNCHISPQGSGLRGELGWYMAKDMGLWKPAGGILGKLYAAESNSALDGALLFGVDFRAQTARRPSSEEEKRKFFPMQMAAHVAYQPSQAITFEGMIELGALARQLGGRPRLYDGQQGWSASVIFQPSYELPQLRVGHFQPSIGMRYDDHTMLARHLAGANSVPLIAPNFAEDGAELSYEGFQWLTLAVGAYLPRALAENSYRNAEGEAVSLVGGLPASPTFSDYLKSPSTLARLVLWLRTEDHVVNTYLGASVFNNKTFTLANFFAGAGITDRLSLMGEYAMSGVQDGRQTRNVTIDLTYQIIPGLLPFARFESGTTKTPLVGKVGEYYTKQIVVGAQIFPLPYLELRPDYRWIDTEAFASTRWTAQLHIFY